MRACEGCRKRKIKCDAATTNSWPCAACVRLKLQCIPPTANYNRPAIGSSQGSGLERILDFADDSGDSGDESYMAQPMMQSDYSSLTSQGGFATSMIGHGQPTYSQHVPQMPMSASEATFPSQATFPPHSRLPNGPAPPTLERSNSWPNDDMSPTDLSEVLGELKIDEKGMGK